MTYEIMDVSESEELVRELMEYARNCPFQGTGAYLAELLAENAFEGYEKVFAAVCNDTIAGFAAIVQKCSCIETEKHFPWLDFLFVDKKYRNQHIGIAFIDKICGYARGLGFESLYLCTVSHCEYYQKIGFEILYATDFYNGARNRDNMYVMGKKL